MAAPTKTDGPDTARKFRVVKGTVGPFPERTVFSEKTFRDVSPPPKEPPQDFNADAYYQSLINRLLAFSVIAPVTDDTAESPSPLGPNSVPGRYSASIEDSTAAVLSQRRALTESTAAQPPATPAPEAPVVQHGTAAVAPPAVQPAAPVTPKK